MKIDLTQEEAQVVLDAVNAKLKAFVAGPLAGHLHAAKTFEESMFVINKVICLATICKRFEDVLKENESKETHTIMHVHV